MHGRNSIFSEATEVYIQFHSLKCIELVCSDSEAWHLLYLVQDNADACNNKHKFYVTRPECTLWSCYNTGKNKGAHIPLESVTVL